MNLLKFLQLVRELEQDITALERLVYLLQNPSVENRPPAEMLGRIQTHILAPIVLSEINPELTREAARQLARLLREGF